MFLYDFKDYFPSLAENVIGILKGTVLNLWIAIGSTTIPTVSILLIHEHGRSSHL